MKISVVTVCFNSAGTIRSTLDSFLSQDWPSKELVVVDGGSSDSTLDLIESFRERCREISVVSEPDNGIYDAMNKGLARFTGDAFGFLNSDDTFHSSGSLSAIARALELADIATGHVDLVKDHASKQRVRHWRAQPHFMGAYRRGWSVPHPGVYCRRSVYDRVGKFDPTYRIAGDYDWLIRAFEIERLVSRVVDDVVVDMAVGGVSTSGLASYVQNARETLRARKRWLGSDGAYVALVANAMKKVGQLRFGS